MKYLTLLLPLVMACAYGNIPDDQPEYGSTKGPGNDPGNGSSAWGDSSNPNNGLPSGCQYDNVISNGQLVASFVVCIDDPQASYKWLVDPPPDGKK